MNNELQYPEIERDIQQCYGILNGDILTVAAKIVDSVEHNPVPGLKVNPVFNSGNHVPVGSIKVMNDFYDEATGFYWFDVKVNPVEHAVTFGFEATAIVDEKRYPLFFKVVISEPSRTVVETCGFNQTDFHYAIGTKDQNDKLQRYPLSSLAASGLVFLHRYIPVNHKGVNFLWKADIESGATKEICVLGNVMIGNDIHPYLIRKTVQYPVVKEISGEQVDASTLSVTLQLDKPVSPHVRIGGRVGYQDEGASGTMAIDLATVLHADNDTLTLSIPIWHVKQKGTVKVRLVINLDDELRTPVIAEVMIPVVCCCNNQTEATVNEVNHQLTTERQSLILDVNWKDGSAVDNFTVESDQEGTSISVKDNRILITRPITVDPDHRNEFTLSGKIHLDEYGIDQPLEYHSTASIGDNYLPLKLVETFCTNTDDHANFFLSVRHNDGSIPANIDMDRIEIVDGPYSDTVRNYHYDQDNGQLQFTLSVPLDKMHYPSTSIKATLFLNFTIDGEKHSTTLLLNDNVKVDYRIFPTFSGYRYQKVDDGYKLIAEWKITDNAGAAPRSVSVMEFNLNGKRVDFGKRYNQSTQTLTIETKVVINHKGKLHLNTLISAQGMSFFVPLPDETIEFMLPGAAVVRDIVLDKEQNQIKVEWDVRGWDDKIPHHVEPDPSGWVPLGGITTDRPYVDYNWQNGVLTCIFTLHDKNASTFAAKNTVQIGKADLTSYPLTFEYKV